MEASPFLGRVSERFQSNLFTVSTVYYTEPVSEDWHYHHSVHLSLILDGGNLESRKRGEIQALPGKVMYYNEGELHRNRYTAHPSKNLNLEIESKFFGAYDLNALDFKTRPEDSTQNFLTLLKIYSELAYNDDFTSDTIACSIISLFDKESTPKTFPLWVEQLREYIEDNWNEFIAIEDMARVVSVHPVTVSRYFRGRFRCTPGDYMRKVKVRRALLLLMDSALPITEIAFLCGFSDHSHMIRSFRRYVGMCPRQVRKI